MEEEVLEKREERRNEINIVRVSDEEMEKREMEGE